MQKILICGGTGFIGRNLIDHFLNLKNYEVHATYHLRQPYFINQIKWHRADLRNPNEVDHVVAGMDILIQAAATTSGAKDILSKPYIHVTDNAVMNSYIFRSAYEHKLKHVLFPSCTVMYPSSDVPLKESDFDANLAIYPKYFGIAQTKLYIEKMCEFYANISETKFTAIRHSNIYGPYDKFDLEKSHVFGATITKVMEASSHITVWGHGEEKRDLLYVSDLTYFVQKAIEQQTSKYRLYHCGSGIAVAIKDLVAQIIAESGKRIRVMHDLSKPSINTSLSLDCALAYEELGWKPNISLEEGIKKTITWWNENIKIKERIAPTST